MKFEIKTLVFVINVWRYQTNALFLSRLNKYNMNYTATHHPHHFPNE